MIAIGRALGDAANVWGIVPLSMGMRAHRWRYTGANVGIRDIAEIRSVCGLTMFVSPQAPLLVQGTFPRCKKCEAAA